VGTIVSNHGSLERGNGHPAADPAAPGRAAEEAAGVD
jgi:hypothetical protein